MTISKSLVLVFLFTLTLTLMHWPAAAQSTTGSISGTISDATGGVLPGVSISVENTDTGITRSVISNDSGRYQAAQLSLGSYRVLAELTGFQTAVRSGIELTIGRNAVVDLTMSVGEVTQTIEVTGEAPLVETTSAEIAGLVDTQQIENLPLNGRDFLQLITLNPGASVMRTETGALSQARGLGMRLSVGGARFNQNTFLMDGTDVNDYAGNTPGSAAGVMLGVDTIREFKVLTNQYSAEYGRQMGGVVTVATRSGTNAFHGTLFEFHRNRVLDARNFFDSGDVPPFIRNQFGATVGGPIIKDRTFFLASYEGFRQTLSQGVLDTVPSLSARQGILNGEQITIAEEVKPFLAFFPEPNGADLGSGRAELFRDANQTVDEDFVVARVDHNLTDSDSLFVRWTFDDALVNDDGISGNVSGVPFGLADGFLKTQFNWTTIEYKKILSPTLLNTARFAYNRTTSQQAGESRLNLRDEDRFIPFGDAPHGSVAVSTWSTLSLRPHASFSPREFFYNHFEYSNSMAYTRGSHSLNFGVNVKRIQDNFFQVFRNGGDFIFTGVRQFLEGTPSQFGFMLPDSDPIKGMRQTLLALHVQDDFSPTPNLTLNLGLRWEMATVWSEVNGKLAVLPNPLTDAQHLVTDKLFGRNPSLKNFAPRFGFAWAPGGDGKMAIRGGFGVFYDLLSSAYLSLIHLNPPFLNNGNVVNPPFPNVAPLLRGPDARVSPRADIVSYLPDQPYRMQWGLSIQQEILPQTVVNIGYVGSHSVHVARADDNFNSRIPDVLADGTLFFPGGTPRRNPNFGTFRVRPTDGHSTYNALQTSLQRRFSNGVQFQFSYTFSKTLDDSSSLFNGNETATSEAVMNTYNRLQDRARADFDVPHVFNGNFTAELPFGQGKRLGGDVAGFGGKLISGWRVGGIITASQGQPFPALVGFDIARAGSGRTGTGQRPDLVPGVPTKIGDPSNWINPDAFTLPEAGFYGNAGRNIVDGPGVATFDFQLTKITTLSERVGLEFRAEFFNISNRSNFRPPSRNSRFVFTSSGAVSKPGRLTGTTTSSRQIQFGLKLTF